VEVLRWGRAFECLRWLCLAAARRGLSEVIKKQMGREEG
jgi:hypothetical protein